MGVWAGQRPFQTTGHLPSFEGVCGCNVAFLWPARWVQSQEGVKSHVGGMSPAGVADGRPLLFLRVAGTNQVGRLPTPQASRRASPQAAPAARKAYSKAT